MSLPEREPTWLVLKKAAEELVKKGRTTFTRRELITYAKKYIDPERPESSLDFEVDLVTVNGSSKDRYRDPEKLFLFRIGRGRYTLYNPEIHGPIEEYLEVITRVPIRRTVVKSIAEVFKARGYIVEEQRGGRVTAPDLVIRGNGEAIGVWIVDPMGEQRSQLRGFAYSLGSAIIERKRYSSSLVIVPPGLYTQLPEDIRAGLENIGVRIAIIKEERRYTVKL